MCAEVGHTPGWTRDLETVGCSLMDPGLGSAGVGGGESQVEGAASAKTWRWGGTEGFCVGHRAREGVSGAL